VKVEMENEMFFLVFCQIVWDGEAGIGVLCFVVFDPSALYFLVLVLVLVSSLVLVLAVFLFLFCLVYLLCLIHEET
jgi:hypothetical protein